MKRRAGLTGWLALLVIGTVIPLLVFAAVALDWLAGSYRATEERGQSDTARALALAVDAQVRAWKAALSTLASSAALREGHWEAFYGEAQAVARRYNGWVVLTDPSGRQRLHLRIPFVTVLAVVSAAARTDAGR